MSYRLYITVTFEFEGFHRWEGAPERHAYLGVNHRHVFKATARKRVSHADRDIEFIEFKRKLKAYAETHFFGPHTLSCEHMAITLADTFGLDSCAVSEDGENGAEVEAISLTEVLAGL